MRLEEFQSADAVREACETAFIESFSQKRLAFARDRFASCGGRMLNALEQLYGDQPKHAFWLIDFCRDLGKAASTRPEALLQVDEKHERKHGGFIDERLVGYAAYVDRFAGTLPGVRKRIGYLRNLGIGYLHLLPFLRARHGENDGGFAVRSFDEIEPSLGTMDDLEDLCCHLRDADIRLCADMVLNHVADDHAWARAALEGDTEYRNFFHTFADRATVDAYESTLDEVFPTAAPGNFSHVPAMGGWVWTTFHSYQWDLNYEHPQVFSAITKALLALANRGIEVFRLDSAPFLWKRKGTSCTNQPEVHLILAALRAAIDLVAPAILLKAEAIMPTSDVVPYFGEKKLRGYECQLAYHSSLMASAWASLAECRADLVRAVIENTPELPGNTGWATYVRCHDDIAWSVLRSDIEACGENFVDRLAPITAFLEGNVSGSYASGTSFQTAQGHTVHGTNGMTASLAGLVDGKPSRVSLALSRLTLMYGLAFWIGAIPLIYMGDELAQPNNMDQADTDLIAVDGRWTERPLFDDERLPELADKASLVCRAFDVLRDLGIARKDVRINMRALTSVVPADDDALLALRRGDNAMAWFNFSGKEIFLGKNIAALGPEWALTFGHLDGQMLPAWGVVWWVRS